MTAHTRDTAVRTLREASLTAESIAWELHLAGALEQAGHYDRESDRLWARSEVVARGEVQPC